MGVPYLLSHYALAQFHAGLYDGEDDSGLTLLWLDGVDDNDDDQQPNDARTPLGLSETDVNVRGSSVKVWIPRVSGKLCAPLMERILSDGEPSP